MNSKTHEVHQSFRFKNGKDFYVSDHRVGFGATTGQYNHRPDFYGSDHRVAQSLAQPIRSREIENLYFTDHRCGQDLFRSSFHFVGS